MKALYEDVRAIGTLKWVSESDSAGDAAGVAVFHRFSLQCMQGASSEIFG